MKVVASSRRHPIVRGAMEATLTIAFLLPENPPAQLLANLPSSEDGLKILVMNTANKFHLTTISGITWVPPTKPSILEAALDAHPECKWIHAFSAGVDYIAEFIKRRLLNSDVALSNGRGAFSDSLAEYAIAAAFQQVLQAVRAEPACEKVGQVCDADDCGQDDGLCRLRPHWPDDGKARGAARAASHWAPSPSKQARAVGRERANLAATYGMDDAATFYSQCDFVVCSLPLTDESKEIINADSFEAMKASTVFISLGRGAVVDEAALHKALTTGQIAGAACDVFATEPLPESSPLWECDNLLMTAHNADLTEDYFPLAVKPTRWRENLEAFKKGSGAARDAGGQGQGRDTEVVAVVVGLRNGRYL